MPVAIWGLTYKPETCTLRRSLAVELCDWLIYQGANLRVYDPAVQKLPSRWNELVERFDNALEALEATKVLVIGTEWSEFKETAKNLFEVVGDDYLVIDANGFLQKVIFSQGINYVAVGLPPTKDEK